jgi:Na+-driven multidrug efflux pump
VTVLIRNIGMLNFMIVGGFQTGNPIRVGNLLGAGRPEHARFSAIVGGVLQSASGIAVSLLWCSIAPTWAALFGLSSAGTDLLIDLMPYAFGLYVGIAIGCGALRSVLTGMALVKVPSIIQVR